MHMMRVKFVIAVYFMMVLMVLLFSGVSVARPTEEGVTDLEFLKGKIYREDREVLVINDQLFSFNEDTSCLNQYDQHISCTSYRKGDWVLYSISDSGVLENVKLDAKGQEIPKKSGANVSRQPVGASGEIHLENGVWKN